MQMGAARNWVHVSDVKGKFQRLHRGSGVVLLFILFATPWLRIDGRPVALFDLPARKLYLLGSIYTPRDSVLLLGLLLVSALSLFLFTSLFGRLWCGFACPQTVFLEELIRPIERLIEGNRGARRKLLNAPWTVDKIRKRLLKWAAFAFIAGIAAMSFGGFFLDSYELWTGQSARGGYLFVLAIGAILFLDFTWFREQFCNYLCPYARFQGVMVDEHSLVVGYNGVRGEPRREKGVKPTGPLGECIGCNQCVTVCPAGIDIRDGFQLECIQCARCIDACHNVMERRDAPSLVEWSSMAKLENRPSRIVRARPAVYGTLLSVVLVAMLVVLNGRETFEFTVAQPPGAAESVREDGRVQNLYQLTVFNNGQEAASYTVNADGLPGAEVVVPGGTLDVPAGSQRIVPTFVLVPADALAPGSVNPFEFVVERDGTEQRHGASFRNRLSGNSP